MDSGISAQHTHMRIVRYGEGKRLHFPSFIQWIYSDQTTLQYKKKVFSSLRWILSSFSFTFFASFSMELKAAVFVQCLCMIQLTGMENISWDFLFHFLRQDAWIVSTPFSFNCEQSLLNALILSGKRNKLCSRALDFIWGCARPKNVIIYSWIEVLHFVYTISLSRQTSVRWCLHVLPSHINSANREIWYLLAFTFSHMISNGCKVMSSPHPFFPFTVNLRSYFNATTTYLYLMCVCNKWRWKY